MQYDLIADNLGDCLLSEPPLAAVAVRTGKPVNVYIKHDYNIPQFYYNPNVNIVDTPGGHEVVPLEAMKHAVSIKLYFGLGFWNIMKVKVGSGDRIEPKIHDLTPRYLDGVLICPFSSSCYSNKGEPPNKQAPVGWWEKVVYILKKENIEVFSLGGKNDPLIPGTRNIRNLSLWGAAEIILGAKVLVTLDSWALHVGACRGNGLICLNSALPDWYVRPNNRIKVIQSHSPLYWSRNELLDNIFGHLELTKNN